MNVPSIYVVVFNQDSAQPMRVTMSTAVKIAGTDTLAPPGVTVNLSSQSFDLAPYSQDTDQDQLTIKVWLDVSEDAIPGVYDVEVNAEGSRDEGGGNFVVVAAAGLRASLIVNGEYGRVTVRSVSPGGRPVTTVVRMFKVIDGTNYEFAYTGSGLIEAAKVSPGHFVAIAYGYYGEELSRQEFDVVSGDDKVVELIVETVYFKTFELGDTSRVRAGSSSRLDMEYAITNVYQAVYNVKVKLLVTIDGALLEEIQVWSVNRLEGGDTVQTYNYAPPDEWQQATYSFRLQLLIEDQVTAETNDETLEVGSPGSGKSSLWILFVILGILAAGGLGFLIFFLLKRRRKEEEKPRKAEKKRKEEKPAPTAVEPVRKPEPYRPPEPVRPAPPPPLPEEEPIVQPSPLASVSSLKARMASMGRDQGAGKPAEEEPGAEKQDNPVETSSQTEESDVVPPPPRAEPEPPAVTKAQKPPASPKPAGQKPGIFSSVTATPKQEPPKPPSDVQINWPPKPVEPPKPPSDVQINWPPKPVEPPKPSGLAEVARQRIEAQPPANPPEEAAVEETKEPEAPPSRSSFAEAARLRLEARQRATEAGKGGAETGKSPTEGDDAGGSGEGEDSPPSP